MEFDILDMSTVRPYGDLLAVDLILLSAHYESKKG